MARVVLVGGVSIGVLGIGLFGALFGVLEVSICQVLEYLADRRPLGKYSIVDK